MSLKDRIDVFCATVGLWSAPILDYFEDIEAAGISDLSEWVEALEMGEFPEVLGAPLLAMGIIGSGRLLWRTYRKMPPRSVRPPWC